MSKSSKAIAAEKIENAQTVEDIIEAVREPKLKDRNALGQVVYMKMERLIGR